MTSLLARIGGYFVAPDPDGSSRRTHAGAPPPTRAAAVPGSAEAGAQSPTRTAAMAVAGSAKPDAASPDDAPAVAGDAGSAAAPQASSSAAVVGPPEAVVPLAAACAGELRARTGAAAAVLCVWRPARPPSQPGALDVPSRDAPAALWSAGSASAALPTDAAPGIAEAGAPPGGAAGATTPAAKRLAARLAAHELPVTAGGRLAWLELAGEPGTAAAQARRCLAIAGAPVVLGVAGPRPAELEPVLAELDLALAVLPADAEPALRALALASLPARERHVVPPLSAGPPRWAAMAGLARLRTLPRGRQ